ncbi:MAG: hypothetical protein A2074_00330 [Candidatus Aquicultor primus]|uniref:Polyprenyl synthetase family protein n=1 Tax=Candidatus Aquicultor primus TaxID=1797195 RepID=A0A1F2USZ6_9ACTN|nr:MAG: hypothetical protein A2074_00330 [Candidatus Aquicultor primus]
MEILVNKISADLDEAKERLTTYAFSDHRLLAESKRVVDDTPLAALLFITASMGRYRSDELVPIGAGLELLRLAVAAHYPDEKTNRDSRKDFLLISADYFYARAIIVAGALGNGRVIEYMVQAIADVATEHVRKREPDVDGGAPGGKHASLFKAAVAIGALLSDCPASAVEPLNVYAEALSGIDDIVLKNNGAPIDNNRADEESLTAFRARLLLSLDAIPLPQARLLEELAYE